MREGERSIEKYLMEAWKRREIYVKSQRLEAYRLATQEELERPVAIDIYAGQAVLQVYDEYLGQEDLEEIKKLLREHFSVQNFFEKKRYRVKEVLGGGGDQREPPVEVVVTENQHKFLVNLNNYLDTGLFLDHRETRKMIEKMVHDLAAIKNNSSDSDGEADIQVLNLFAYTGSFSVYAARGGAAMTHTVDLSKTYCEWARRNLDLNECPESSNWIYRMDVWEFYKYAARKGLTFDLIIIDPPTFSRNKDSNFSVQRDHQKLLLGAANLLRQDGVILFSNNCLDFQMATQMEQYFQIRDIQNETIPMDFWIDTIHRDWWEGKNQIHNCFLLKKAP